MSDLNLPNVDEPVETAIQMAIDYVLERFDNVLGIIVAGSILRGEGDAHSDVDTFIIFEGDYRQRIQKFSMEYALNYLVMQSNLCHCILQKKVVMVVHRQPICSQQGMLSSNARLL